MQQIGLTNLRQYCSCVFLSVPKSYIVRLEGVFGIPEIDLGDCYGLPLFGTGGPVGDILMEASFIRKKRKRKYNLQLMFKLRNFIPKKIMLTADGLLGNILEYKRFEKLFNDAVKTFEGPTEFTIDATFEYPEKEYASVLRLPHEEPLAIPTAPLSIGEPRIIGLQLELENSEIGLNIFEQTVMHGLLINKVQINYETTITEGLKTFLEAYNNAKKTSDLFIRGPIKDER